MEVVRARVLGFCFGVRRAIEAVERATRSGPLETLGPVVHNRQVVDALAAKGARAAASLQELSGGRLALPSHGVAPETLARLQGQVEVIDATCPFVRRAQQAARRLAAGGFAVVVFGDLAHPEVHGLLGWAGGSACATLDWCEAARYAEGRRRVGVIAQTTQNIGAFRGFIQRLVDARLDGLLELRVINTVCDATSERQQAALELAGKVDAVVVVGGRHSSNTRRLAEICAGATGVPTHLVESAQELEAGWFAGVRRVGLTAGASTPEEVIAEVERRLKEMS